MNEVGPILGMWNTKRRKWQKNPLSTIFDTLNQENNAWKTLASLQSNEWQDHKNRTINSSWKNYKYRKEIQKSIYLSIYLSIFLSIYLLIHLSTYLPTCLPLPSTLHSSLSLPSSFLLSPFFPPFLPTNQLTDWPTNHPTDSPTNRPISRPIFWNMDLHKTFKILYDNVFS